MRMVQATRSCTCRAGWSLHGHTPCRSGTKRRSVRRRTASRPLRICQPHSGAQQPPFKGERRFSRPPGELQQSAEYRDLPTLEESPVHNESVKDRGSRCGDVVFKAHSIRNGQLLHTFARCPSDRVRRSPAKSGVFSVVVALTVLCGEMRNRQLPAVHPRAAALRLPPGWQSGNFCEPRDLGGAPGGRDRTTAYPLRSHAPGSKRRHSDDALDHYRRRDHAVRILQGTPPASGARQLLALASREGSALTKPTSPNFPGPTPASR